ncbi:unnamed protein product [Sympodiomycopsis kandeliae]
MSMVKIVQNISKTDGDASAIYLRAHNHDLHPLSKANLGLRNDTIDSCVTPSSCHINQVFIMAYKPHRHFPDKQRQVAGWKAALNNPSTTSEARWHARKSLLFKGHVKDALFTHASFNTRVRRVLGLRAKRR